MALSSENKKGIINKILGYFLLTLGVILVILVFGGAYIFIIQPQLIDKPFIEKPFLNTSDIDAISQGQDVINDEHLNFIANEIGAFKLKKGILNREDPKIEFYITDTQKSFTTVVIDNVPITSQGQTSNPDLKIIGEQETVANILQRANVNAAIKEELDKGTIQVELLADLKTLAEKGFLAIYDAIK